MESESSWSWRAPLESSSLISLFREGSAKPDGSCPGVFWMSPNMETSLGSLVHPYGKKCFFSFWRPGMGSCFLPCSFSKNSTTSWSLQWGLSLTFQSLNRPSLLVSEVHCSVLSCRLLNHLCQEVVIVVLQKHPGLLVPGCFVPSTDFTVIEVTHGDQDVQTWDLFQLSGQVLMYFFFLIKQSLTDNNAIHVDLCANSNRHSLS